MPQVMNVSGSTDGELTGGADVLEVTYREYLADGLPKLTYSRNMVIDALPLLREHADLEPDAFRARLSGRHANQCSTERTLWTTVTRHLKDLAGFDGQGSVTWSHADDGAVWSVSPNEP